MVVETKNNAYGADLTAEINQMDVQDIRAADNTFDLIVGCHMLYHVPNIPKALSEIHRVLKESGRFVSTTTSISHLKELRDFLNQFDLSISLKSISGITLQSKIGMSTIDVVILIFFRYLLKTFLESSEILAFPSG